MKKRLKFLVVTMVLLGTSTLFAPKSIQASSAFLCEVKSDKLSLGYCVKNEHGFDVCQWEEEALANRCYKEIIID
jgi:hypothetical protein